MTFLPKKIFDRNNDFFTKKILDRNSDFLNEKKLFDRFYDFLKNLFDFLTVFIIFYQKNII